MSESSKTSVTLHSRELGRIHAPADADNRVFTVVQEFNFSTNRVESKLKTGVLFYGVMDVSW
jgi:hypothetical protein